MPGRFLPFRPFGKVHICFLPVCGGIVFTFWSITTSVPVARGCCPFFCLCKLVIATPKAIFRRSFSCPDDFCLSDRLGRYVFVFCPFAAVYFLHFGRLRPVCPWLGGVVCLAHFSVCLSLFLLLPRTIFAGAFLARAIFAFPNVWGGMVLFVCRMRQYSFYILVDYDQSARGSGVLFALPIFLSV